MGKGDLEKSRFDWVFLNDGLPNTNRRHTQAAYLECRPVARVSAQQDPRSSHAGRGGREGQGGCQHGLPGTKSKLISQKVVCLT